MHTLYRGTNHLQVAGCLTSARRPNAAPGPRTLENSTAGACRPCGGAHGQGSAGRRRPVGMWSAGRTRERDGDGLTWCSNNRGNSPWTNVLQLLWLDCGQVLHAGSNALAWTQIPSQASSEMLKRGHKTELNWVGCAPGQPVMPSCPTKGLGPGTSRWPSPPSLAYAPAAATVCPAGDSLCNRQVARYTDWCQATCLRWRDWLQGLLASDPLPLRVF